MFVVTLLLGTVSDPMIVITADGWTTRDGVVERQDLKKIFTVDNMPLAIAHHGLNELDGHSVEGFLAPFMANAPAQFVSLGLREITTRLRDFVNSAATVATNSQPAHVVGFWVSGYDVDTSTCRLYEIFWKAGRGAQLTRRWPLIRGGSGQNFVEWDDGELGDVLNSRSVEDTSKFHMELYNAADKRQPQDKVFGGHIHQLLIDRHACHWIIEPAPVPSPAASPSPSIGS